MSLCSELENINTSINYFCFIKEVFDDYMQCINNYKVITNDYLKKLMMLQDKFKYKLTGKEKDNTKYKNVNTNHIFSLTSPISKIIDKQIENLQMFIDGINGQIENNNKVIKEKEILSNKFQLMFEEARKDLLKKYREIDKLRDIYKMNMANTEDMINKYYNKKDNNNTITKDQMKNMISSTKKIEKDYKNLINSTKLYEETFDSLYLSSLENFKKLSSETSNQMKDSIIDFIVLFKNNVKMQLSEIDMYLPELSDLDEVKVIENIIISSYRKNNKLIHVKPEKYKLKIFQKKNEVEEGKEAEENLNTNLMLNLEDGFEEMLLIKDEALIKTIKMMRENFELFEDNNLNLEIEEEKIKCLQLTQKIFNLENPKSQNNFPTEEEIDQLDKLLDKHHNRVVFLQQLSEFRNKGKFEISQKTFDIFDKLFNTMINTVQRDNDFHSVKNAIIISQTYYIKGEKENDKIYLQKRIQNNEIFKSQKFWEEFLEFSINKEIVNCVSNDVKSGNILKENRRETEDKMSNIAFSQIVPYTDNMKEFGLDKEIIKQVVFPRMEKYKMSDELIESIKGIIDK
jgi:hypothetical protein